VTELLGQVRVPTLVLHARGDAVPFEQGRKLAAGIPGAKFVALQSNNHILLEQDPATPRFFDELSLFLAK
jgi:pimeloyl-ACP methyl ester carboxylesterase